MEPIEIIVVVLVALFIIFNIYLRIKHKKRGISLGCEGCEHAGESCSSSGSCPAIENALASFREDDKNKEHKI